jgi:hypothetical protein
MLFVLVLLVVEEEDDKTIGLVKIKSKRKNTERFFREFIFFLRGERERERGSCRRGIGVKTRGRGNGERNVFKGIKARGNKGMRKYYT